jgi:hypothetical protein
MFVAGRWALVLLVGGLMLGVLPNLVLAQTVPSTHPRVLITPEMVKEMAEKVKGPFAEEYQTLLETAKGGPRFLENVWSTPGGFMESGLAYLIEKELGRDGKPYAEGILKIWRDPKWQQPGLARHFGWQGLLYDWLYDAMTPEERAKFGELLGEWVATWWKTPEVNIDRSGWWYNQHWGPSHLDVNHNRVALTSKLFIDLATLGNAGKFESAVQTNLKEFCEKFRGVGLPALDEMGGIWAESNGHGGYGPTYTVPLAYQAVKTGTDFDPYAASAPHGFAPEYIKAGIYCLMPHNDKMAYIDDGNSGYPDNYARSAPMFARAYGDGVARWLSDTALKEHWLYNQYLKQDEVWQRIAFLPADLKPVSPKEAGWPLAYYFRGAGHVYMRGAWDDPGATFAFFGAGPSYAAHSRDDEGTFLITKKGQLVNRSGGQGHNDGCYYTGGSLVYNIVTIYAPEEKMRRDAYNENDGGLLRYVYDGPYPKERGHITAYWHDDNVATYASADLTQGYWSEKAKEVTRQFLYLRGKDECFVIFDRVEATKADYPKVWFLHLPSEPEVSGAAEVKVPDHVIQYAGDTATWLSDEAGDTGMLTKGKSRLTMKTLAPNPARITKRGGQGHDFWGNPYNPQAQYNHTLDNKGQQSDAYLKPTLSPWRLEVEPTTSEARDYFLHVLFVTDEGARQPDAGAKEVPQAERVEEGDRVGARLRLGDREVTVLFNRTGDLGGHLNVTEAGKTLHDAELAQSVPKD